MTIMDRDRPAPSRRSVEMLFWFDFSVYLLRFSRPLSFPGLRVLSPIVDLGGQ